MFENILVIGMIVLVVAICIGGWWYENFGPEANSGKNEKENVEEENK